MPDLLTGASLDLLVALAAAAAVAGAATWWRRRRTIALEGLRIRSGPSLPPSFLFPRAPAEPLPAPLDHDRYLAWADRNGGVVAYTSILSFVLRGSVPATVWDVRVVLLDRGPPIDGILYENAVGGGLETRSVSADLDAADGRGRVPTTRHGPGDDPADGRWDWPVTVGPEDAESFSVRVEGAEGHYRWCLEIDYSTRGGDRTTVRVPRRGAWSFSTTQAARETVPVSVDL